MKQLPTTCKIILSLTASALSLSGSSAFADSPRGDVFNRSTTSVRLTPSAPQQTPTFLNKPPIRIWYDALDQQLVSSEPTPEQQASLTRSFGSPPKFERVVEWINTASTISKRYHYVARYLKNSPLPREVMGDPASADLDSYKQELAQWYDDSGAWFDDMIKPCRPASTIEELDKQLKVMKDRSDEQKETITHLLQMDSKLRDHFKVHQIDDSIWQYAKKPLEKSN